MLSMHMNIHEMYIISDMVTPISRTGNGNGDQMIVCFAEFNSNF